MLKISKVEKNGIGRELGLKAGDVIVAFDGFSAEDVLDYTFYDYKESFSMTCFVKNKKHVTFEIEKDESESLGLIFESDNLDIKTCYNKCLFCFIDQMPPNMRKSLYVKDDDYRQSFLCGNFVTLTNVTDSDVDRIIRLKLSPLYVSVHAMDSDVRKKLLNNKNAGNISSILKKLTDNGIKIETQIVLVKGVNDGKILEDSLKELYSLRPNLKSVAVVPCGITKYRKNLFEIEDITEGYSKCVINEVMAFNKSVGENFAVLGDEFYNRAKMPVESYEFYGNFTQLGNGVGGSALFTKELEDALEENSNKGSYLLVTGESAFDFITNATNKVKGVCPNITANVLKVKNNFFGETCNCTGLLTGEDIYLAIKDCNFTYDYVIIPDVTLKQDEDVFLDDMTLLELKNKINKKIIITNGSGLSFYHALTGGSDIRIVL